MKAIKEKYVKVMEAYKEGYTKMLEACDTNDEQTVTEATEKIDEGIKLLDDYNKALECKRQILRLPLNLTPLL